LKVELARHPKDRTPVRQLTKTSREEFDRLMETSPSIPEDVVGMFNSEVVRKIEKKKRDIKVPEICGDLQETKVFHPDTESEDEGIDNVSNQINWEQLRMIEKMKEEFIQVNGREATEDEIMEMVKESVDKATKKTLEMKTIQQSVSSSSANQLLSNDDNEDDYV
jgi:hypothetical protein